MPRSLNDREPGALFQGSRIRSPAWTFCPNPVGVSTLSYLVINHVLNMHYINLIMNNVQ